MGFLKELLEDNIKDSYIITKEGDKRVNLGKIKIELVDLILLLIKQKDIGDLPMSLNKHKIPQALLSLMTLFYEHTILHIQIYKIFSEALKSEDDNLIKAFSINCDLGNVLYDMFIEGKKGFAFKKEGKILRKQYIVFVTSLSTILNDLSKNKKYISDYLNQQVKGWIEYSSGELKEIRIREDTKIAGEPKKESSPLYQANEYFIYLFII